MLRVLGIDFTRNRFNRFHLEKGIDIKIVSVLSVSQASVSQRHTLLGILKTQVLKLVYVCNGKKRVWKCHLTYLYRIVFK